MMLLVVEPGKAGTCAASEVCGGVAPHRIGNNQPVRAHRGLRPRVNKNRGSPRCIRDKQRSGWTSPKVVLTMLNNRWAEAIVHLKSHRSRVTEVGRGIAVSLA